MRYRVVYSDMAKKDIDAIYTYIAYKLNVPNIAVKQVDRLLNAIDTLVELPFRHKLHDKEPFKSKGLRCFRVDNYIIFYYSLEEEAMIKIMRIVYKARDMENIF